MGGSDSEVGCDYGSESDSDLSDGRPVSSRPVSRLTGTLELTRKTC